jgi:hypothetical protein
MIRSLRFAATAAAALCAAGALTIGAAAAPAKPKTSHHLSPPRQVVKLTEADSGRTVTLSRGDMVKVILGSPMGTWSVPRSSDTSVLLPVSGHPQPNGRADGRFGAVGGGMATLTASDSPRCAPMCKIASRMWSVTVNVAGGHVSASEANNGTTVTMHRGDTLNVTLHSTYWTIQGSSNPTVLVQQGPQTTTPEPPSSRRCVPGQGCGTVSADFLAAAAGNADVTASRTSCGEALRCTPAQSTWTLHVIVVG